MTILLVVLTIFIFSPEKKNEALYLQLNEKGMETVELYKKKFPFKEPYFIKLEIVSKNDKRVPFWASGIYYNRTILLREDKIENLLRTLNHEIAHSFLDETINHQKIPLWFEEGLAQVMAGEEEDLITLFLLNLTGGLSLKDLGVDFPSSFSGKRIAYAKSRKMVLKMIDRIGWDGFYVFLFNLGRGIPFEKAFFIQMGENLNSFEKGFAKERIYKIFLILGTGSLFFWFILSIFIIITFFLKRKKNKNLVKSWEEDDTDLPYF